MKQRLETFMVRSHCSESDELVLKKAIELGNKMAKINNWKNIEVRISNIPGVREGKYFFDFFEVWGVVLVEADL